MTGTVILADFGASRIKSCIWSFSEERLLETLECESPTPSFGVSGEVQLDPEAYWLAFEKTAGKLANRYQDVNSIWLCTEMHGFLISTPDGYPITPYISWRDQRATIGHSGTPSTLSRLSLHSSSIYRISGMYPRAGLPLITLADIQANRILPPSFRIMTLADWLLYRGGERCPGIHASLAAGTALFDIEKSEWSSEIISLAGVDRERIIFPRIVDIGSRVGEIMLAGKKLAVFGAIGDMQSALLGAGFPDASTMAINLGTGSQIARSCRLSPDTIEKRPSIRGGIFSAITHIPSGRALSVFADFFEAIGGTNHGSFWELFTALSGDEVLDSPFEVDLRVFDSAWKYKDGGFIKQIKEGVFTPRKLVASIARGWLKQYEEAMQQIDPLNAEPTFILSGGLSRRGSFIASVLERMTRRIVILADSVTGEETMDGLLSLAGSEIKGIAAEDY